MEPVLRFLSSSTVHQALFKVNESLSLRASDTDLPGWLELAIFWGKEMSRCALLTGLVETAGDVGVSFTLQLLEILNSDLHIAFLCHRQFGLWKVAVTRFPDLALLSRAALYFSVVGAMALENKDDCVTLLDDLVTPIVSPTVRRIVRQADARFVFHLANRKELQDVNLTVNQDRFMVSRSYPDEMGREGRGVPFVPITLLEEGELKKRDHGDTDEVESSRKRRRNRRNRT